LLESALSGHLEICTGKPPVKEVFVKPEPILLPIKIAEVIPQPVAAPIIVKKPVKKRKVPTEVSTKPKEAKKTKSTTIFNLDVQCGVVTETGVRCARSITCKVVISVHLILACCDSKEDSSWAIKYV
jgi:SCA7, zinc-binding domain